MLCAHVFVITIQVTFVDRSGKSGRGVCLQDIEATPDVCMSRIRDLPHYKDMVSSGKSILTYINITYAYSIVYIISHTY